MLPYVGIGSYQGKEADNIGGTMHVVLSSVITSGIVVFSWYSVVMKDSKLGKRLVVHPVLQPEAMPSTYNSRLKN